MPHALPIAGQPQLHRIRDTTGQREPYHNGADPPALLLARPRDTGGR